MEAVCEATGAAESYRVSVSCVGSDCSLHVRDSVPAPQSQKNLQHEAHQSNYSYWLVGWLGFNGTFNTE